MLFGRHPGGGHDAAHVRLEAHIQHAVGLVQHKVAHLTQPHLEQEQCLALDQGSATISTQRAILTRSPPGKERTGSHKIL